MSIASLANANLYGLGNEEVITDLGTFEYTSTGAAAVIPVPDQVKSNIDDYLFIIQMKTMAGAASNNNGVASTDIVNDELVFTPQAASDRSVYTIIYLNFES